MMKETLTEAFYTEGSLQSSSGPIDTTTLEMERLQCKRSLQQESSHIAASQIEDVLDHSGIDKNEVDRQTYRQLDRLYLRKKINMLDELISTIDPSSIPSNTITQAHVTPKSTGITFEKLYELFLEQKRIDAPDTSNTTFRDYDAAYKDLIYVIEGAAKRDISLFTIEELRGFSHAIHSALDNAVASVVNYSL